MHARIPRPVPGFLAMERWLLPGHPTSCAILSTHIPPQGQHLALRWSRQDFAGAKQQRIWPRLHRLRGAWSEIRSGPRGGTKRGATQWRARSGRKTLWGRRPVARGKGTQRDLWGRLRKVEKRSRRPNHSGRSPNCTAWGDQTLHARSACAAERSPATGVRSAWTLWVWAVRAHHAGAESAPAELTRI